nr:zinc ribbon domain-containing protein [Acidobacteriota bacterium]
LVDYTEIKAPIRPQSLLPFKISEAQVREQIRRWYASKWLAPGRLKSRALVDRVRGVYIPYWTFDAQAVCPWEAEAGHYYYTTEAYRDNQGRSQTRQVRHVRWEPASGLVRHFFDDEPVPGTRGVSHALLGQIEPFRTAELVPYDTAFLSGFIVEHYQIVLLDAAQASQDAMTRKLEEMCAAEVPGDTYRNLQIHPVFSGQTFKHILVPVWLLSYLYGTITYQVVVNGYDGRMAGQYPKSPWKIALLVLLAIIVFMIFVLLNQNN